MMLKQKLNPFRIGKGLFSLLAMFVMLLAPQVVWAQTDYGLTVAGVAVTSDNAANVLGDQNDTHMVSYDPSTNTLTLNNASFSGQIVWANETDLTVEFKGSSTIYMEGDKLFKTENTAAKLLFVNTGGSACPLTITNYSNFMSQWADGSVVIGESADGESDWWLNDNTGTSYEAKLMWEHQYGLSIGQIAVTNANAANVLSDQETPTVVFTPATGETAATLTLNGASLNGHIVWNNTTDLTIHIVGNCSVFGDYPSSDNPVIKGNGGALLFTSSETTPGSLYVGLTSVMSKFASGWNDSSTRIWTVDSQGDAIDYDWWANQGCDYMTIAPNKKYDLKINGEQFCDAWYKQQNNNAEYPELTITDGNTLHISTKTDYAITSNMPALMVAVMGNASLSSIRFEAAGQVTSGTLTITKDSESDHSMNSLSLKNTKDNLATMSGFSTVEFNSPMTLKTPSEAPTWDSYTGDVFVSDFVSYGITVNGIIVGEPNAADVLDDNTVSYNAQTNTLTLKNLDVHNEYSDKPEPFVKNGHGNLIIQLEGQPNFVWNNSVFIAKDGNAAEDYTVTFTTNSASPSNLTFRSSGDVFSTGHQVVYNNGLVLDISDLDDDYHTYDMTIQQVEYDLTVASVAVNSTNASDILGDGKVSYDRQTNKLTLNGATIQPDGEAPGIDYTGDDNLTISFSGTNTIAGADGCSAIRYNGVSQTPPTLTFESSSTSSTLTLTETSSSVIQYFGSVLGVNGINDASGNSLALMGGGVSYSAGNGLYTGADQEINPVTSATITSGPPAPTIAFDGTKTYLNTDKVTISLPESLADDQNAVIVYSWDESCEPGNANNYSDASGVPLNAGTNTLYAWVRYYGLYSARVSQAFTAKTDIDQFEVTGLIETESIVYTGSAIEPTFTLYDAKEPTNTLSADNYDVRIEKYSEAAGYTEVQSIVDAGIYMVYAVGKGDTYGGEKLVYEALEVTKANIQGLPTDANYYLTYNGTLQNLITVTVPEGATVKYYSQAITQEDYEDDSFELLCEVSDENFTTTVPTGTNAGYFALLYKVDGGSNYNDKRATQTIKVEIVPAEITEVTLTNSTLEYNGESQVPTIASVKAGELTLTTNDYDVSYNVVDGQTSSPVDAPVETGTYNAVVAGKGNFKGTQSAEFSIVYQTLDLGNVTFPQGQQWTTYYNSGYTQALPDGQNIGAFVASGVSDNEVTVAQIKYIPQGQAVLLNNATQTTTENIFGQNVTGNLLLHAVETVAVNAEQGDYYGLYNGAFERVKGTIPAGKNYLMVPNAVVPGGNAPKLTIVIDGIGNMTGIGHIEAIIDSENVYDLQGRKIDKPSKKGLYIMKGRKMVVK